MSTVYYASATERKNYNNYTTSRRGGRRAAASAAYYSDFEYAGHSAIREAAVRRSASRKAAAARARKKSVRELIVCAAAILMLCVIVLFGTQSRAFADAQNENGLNKYYTSIEVKSGDTLWALADQYMAGSDMTKKEYVNQLIRLNDLPASGELHTGENIVVVYYSDEIK